MIIVLTVCQILQAWIAVAQSDCQEKCADYHRVCPAIRDSSYAAKFEDPEVAEVLSLEKLPTPLPTADNCGKVYSLLCPASCGVCVPCSETLLAEVAELKAAAAESRVPPAVPLVPTDLLIVAAYGSVANGDSMNIAKALDKKANTLYHSRAASNNPYLEFYIGKSKVTSVKVQNRHDCCEDRMNGESVLVCDGNNKCTTCGVFNNVGQGKWGTVQCGNANEGIEGNVIKVTVPSAHLQIAEVQVKGVAGNQLSELTIQPGSCTSSTPHGSFPLANSWDGRADTMFHSAGNSGWTKYAVTEAAAITLVRVQNRQDCCDERLTNADVWVCSSAVDSSCTHCGKITEAVGKSEWGAVKCGGADGINGRFVKVQARSDAVLQIAEIKIYAN